MNLLDTSGAHHPPTQPRVKALPHHRASIRPGLAEQLLVRKLKVKPASEEMKSGKKLARTEGRVLLPVSWGIAVLSSASNSRKIQPPSACGCVHCAPQKLPHIMSDQLNL